MADRRASIPGGTIVFHSKGFKELLESEQVQGIVKRAAAQATAAASKYGKPADTKRYDYKVGETDRARAIVFTDTPHAMRSNLKHNSLKKAIRQVKI